MKKKFDPAVMQANREHTDAAARTNAVKQMGAAQTVNPIYWESITDASGTTTSVVDLRTLPDTVTVSIIQAALEVSFRYGNGEIAIDESEVNAEAALAHLADATNAIERHMHSVPKSLHS